MSQHVPTALPPHVEPLNIAVVSTEWNSHITGALENGVTWRLNDLGYNPEACCKVFHVPGAVELTFAASQLIESGLFDAIIVLGCVIRGDTPHFDYVCQSVTQGVTQLNADVDTPVVFGVLTVNNERQAADRAGGSMGNKGVECVDCALKMIDFRRRVESL